MDTATIRKLPREHRKTFIGLLVSILVLLLLIDYAVLPETHLNDVVRFYVRAFASALLTSLFFYWIVTSFTPFQDDPPGLEELQPSELTPAFEELMASSNRWRYKGNFGRNFRGSVLPTLRGKQNCHVSACLIDPGDKTLCEKHAWYRNGNDGVDSHNADAVAEQVLVTIVVCAWYVSNTRLSIDVFLTSTFDPVRIDSSDEAMILTVEDRKKSGLKILSTHFAYQHLELSMEFARTQARKIELDGVRRDIQLAQLDENDVSNCLEKAGFQALCQRLTPKRILRSVHAAHNPYA